MLKTILAGSSAFREHGKFWTAAWSLVEGCTPVSPGCAHCWLSALEGRVGAHAVEGSASIPSPLAPGGVFNGKIVCREDRLLLPLRARKPRVYSIWSDLGHEDVPFGFHALAHDVMKRSPQHHFLIITKRPQSFLYNDCRFDALPNVTILVTMEDQDRARERAPFAARLALSGWRVGVLCEPLLSPISFRWITGDFLAVNGRSTEHDFLRLMCWVITGGESGSKARPVHPEWVRALRDQAQVVGVPFTFKQWGEWGPGSYLMGTGQPVFRSFESKLQWFHKGNTWINDGLCLDLDGKVLRRGGDFDAAVYPVAVVHKLGKKKTGRVLDGREWLDLP
jgi:protein gp37